MDDLEWLQGILDDKFQGNQAAMARWLERQPAQINQYLKGRRKIGADFREHVRSKLGISSDWPFSMFTLEEYKSLPDAEKESIEDYAFARIGRNKQRKTGS
jgi:plasmid maintenance system antidote protein VapI